MIIPRFNAALRRQKSFRNLDVADLLYDDDTPRFAEVVVSKKTTDLDDSNAQQNETPIREANAPQEDTTGRPHGKLLLAEPVTMESSSASWLELSFVALKASQSGIDAPLEQHKTKQKKEKRRDGERPRRSKRSNGSERQSASRSRPTSLRRVSRSLSTRRTPITRCSTLRSSKKGSDNTDPSCPGSTSKTTTKVSAKLVNRLSVERSHSFSFSADNETAASRGRLSSRKSPSSRKLTRMTSTKSPKSMTLPSAMSTPRYSTRSGRRRHKMGRKEAEEHDLRIRARRIAIFSSIDTCLDIL